MHAYVKGKRIESFQGLCFTSQAGSLMVIIVDVSVFQEQAGCVNLYSVVCLGGTYKSRSFQTAFSLNLGVWLSCVGVRILTKEFKNINQWAVLWTRCCFVNIKLQSLREKNVSACF